MRNVGHVGALRQPGCRSAATVSPSIRRIGALLLGLTLWSTLSPPLLMAAESGWLRLLVHQPGLIYLDGDELLDLTGRSARRPVPWSSYTVSVMAVPDGEHRIELRPADVAAVPPFETIDLSVAPGDTLTVRLGAPLVLTSPPGARILMDGEEMGAAPIRLDPTKLPGKKILFEHPGYQRRTVDGDSLLDLARLAGAARFELEPLGVRTVNDLEAPAGTSWVDRNASVALLGSLVLLAGGVTAGVHFKGRADGYFNEYKRKGNREEQARLFDEAQKYDRISLGSWAVAEAAFFAAFFLLIREPRRPMVPNPSAPAEPLAGAARNGEGHAQAGELRAPADLSPDGRGRTQALLSPVAPDGDLGITLRISHGF